MRASVWVGIVLIVAGVVLFLRGGFTRKEKDIDIGPLSVSHTEHESIPPWVSGLVVAAGVVLVGTGLQRRNA